MPKKPNKAHLNYHLFTAEPPLICRITDWKSIQTIQSFTVSDAVSKMRVVHHRVRSESPYYYYYYKICIAHKFKHARVGGAYHTISTDINCHQTHCEWQFCLSARQCTGKSGVHQSNCCRIKLKCHSSCIVGYNRPDLNHHHCQILGVM